MEKMEKVEALRNKAGVSYEDAKAALEANDWDVLDAMIALEKEGKVKMSTYSTKTEALSGEVVTESGQRTSEESKGKKFFNWCAEIFNKANRNSLEISKEGRMILSVPVSVCCPGTVCFLGSGSPYDRRIVFQYAVSFCRT